MIIEEISTEDLTDIIFEGTEEQIIQLKRKILSNIKDGLTNAKFSESDLERMADEFSSGECGLEGMAFIEVYENEKF